VVQPYRDLAKLLRKGTVQSDTASGFYRAIPPIVLASTVSAASMVPVLVLPAAVTAPPLGDAILLIGLLALGRFLTALGALDAGGAFGGMGASREMTLGPLVEPVLLLVVFSVAVAAGTTDLAELAARRATHAELAWRAPDILALGAALVLLLAESGRIPVDNPDTHLELTMIHEGMLLEASGRSLALLVYASELKLVLLAALFAAAFLPFGAATELTPLPLLLGIGIGLVKIFLIGQGLALLDATVAKARILALPDLLGLASLLALTGLGARLLLVP
jgi:formate hydrogenlyase subunit 4